MAVARAEDLVPVFEAAFNARDKDALLRLYVPDAAHTFDGVRINTGIRAISAAFDRGFAGPHKLSGTVLSCLVVNDTALIRALWASIHPDGTTHGKNISCEVATRGSDGLWRYIIDDASGGSRAAGTGET